VRGELIRASWAGPGRRQGRAGQRAIPGGARRQATTGNRRPGTDRLWGRACRTVRSFFFFSWLGSIGMEPWLCGTLRETIDPGYRGDPIANRPWIRSELTQTAALLPRSAGRR
jgi:hypothetical protein